MESDKQCRVCKCAMNRLSIMRLADSDEQTVTLRCPGCGGIGAIHEQSEITRLRAELAAVTAERDAMITALAQIDFMPLPVDEADSHSVILNIKYIARSAISAAARAAAGESK